MEKNPTLKGGITQAAKVAKTAKTPKPAPDAPTTSAPSTSPTAPAPSTSPAKSPRRRKIILLSAIAGAVVLLLASLAVWFFAFYSKPEKVLLDGLGNLLRSPNVSLEGGGSLTLREADSSSPVRSAILNFNSSGSRLPNATDVSLFVELSEGRSLNLQLGSVRLADGAIYLKISGVMDSLRSLKLDSETEGELTEIFNAAETVDGEWWRISVRDLALKVTGSETSAGLYGDFYDCALEASSRDDSKELLDLLKNHPFADIAPLKKFDSPNAESNYTAAAGYQLYEIKLKSEELAAFLNAAPHTSKANEILACYNDSVTRYSSHPNEDRLSLDDLPEISASDLTLPEDFRLYIEVSRFSHKIRNLWVYNLLPTWDNSFAVTFNYQSATVSAPSEYRDLTELFDEFSYDDLYSELSGGSSGSKNAPASGSATNGANNSSADSPSGGSAYEDSNSTIINEIKEV